MRHKQGFNILEIVIFICILGGVCYYFNAQTNSKQPVTVHIATTADVKELQEVYDEAVRINLDTWKEIGSKDVKTLVEYLQGTHRIHMFNAKNLIVDPKTSITKGNAIFKIKGPEDEME